MRIHIVNPNSTVSMTRTIAEAARLAASSGTEIIATTSFKGPPAIQGYYDGALALPGLLEEIGKAEADGVDAHIIACFDDTGLDAARALARAPVIGIGEAGYHLACLIAGRFGVVTTLSCSVPILEDNLRRYGLMARCTRVRASEVPVLALEEPGSDARNRISAEIAAAIAEDGAEAIVLGCAGMADLAASLSILHKVPVVDGVAAAVRMAESLVSLGLSTSKSGGWAFPRAKGDAGPSEKKG